MQACEVKSLSCVQLFATPWAVAYQAPSMGFSRQEYWSGLPFPSPEDLRSRDRTWVSSIAGRHRLSHQGTVSSLSRPLLSKKRRDSHLYHMRVTQGIY